MLSFLSYFVRLREAAIGLTHVLVWDVQQALTTANQLIPKFVPVSKVAISSVALTLKDGFLEIVELWETLKAREFISEWRRERGVPEVRGNKPKTMESKVKWLDDIGIVDKFMN